MLANEDGTKLPAEMQQTKTTNDEHNNLQTKMSVYS